MEIPKITDIFDNLPLKKQQQEKAVKKIREEEKKVQKTEPGDSQGEKRKRIDEYA